MIVFKAKMHAHLPIFLFTSPTHLHRNKISKEKSQSLQVDNEKYLQTGTSHTSVGVHRNCQRLSKNFSPSRALG